jgi:hypothetical protein
MARLAIDKDFLDGYSKLPVRPHVDSSSTHEPCNL